VKTSALAFSLILLAYILLGVRPVFAQNLALGKTATTSSTPVQVAANALDGNMTSRWESPSTDDQSITVDLGSLQKVDRIRLYWEAAFGRAFTLDVSADNNNWKTVASESNNNSTTNEYSHLVRNANGATTSVRYVRMTGITRATQYGYSLFEFEVYSYSAGDNLALGKTLTASTSQSGFPATQAADDNSNTRWGSEYDTTVTPIAPDSNYIYVDLRGIANITQVGLYWESAYASDFKLEVSNDAKTWKGIKRVSGNTQTTNVMAVSASGRYLRMHGLKRAMQQYGYSLWEFSVMGTMQPLPVTLTSFSAAVQGTGVGVNWATASEQHNAGFEVQRSADGASFTTLALVAGAGTTPTTHTYTYVDAAPLRTTAYYRLKQLDIDGTFAYSSVVAVQAQLARAASPVLSLYPNPTADRATLAWEATTTATGRWYLTSTTGRVVHAEALTQQAGANALALDLQSYSAGSYVLTVEAAGQAICRTLVQKAN
jgi:hypothetical protein